MGGPGMMGWISWWALLSGRNPEEAPTPCRIQNKFEPIHSRASKNLLGAETSFVLFSASSSWMQCVVVQILSMSLSPTLLCSTYVVSDPQLVPIHMGGMESRNSWRTGGGALGVCQGCQGQS